MYCVTSGTSETESFTIVCEMTITMYNNASNKQINLNILKNSMEHVQKYTYK